MKSVRKTTRIQGYQLPIEIKREGDYFLAACPLWNDCYAQGRSIDEATAEMIAVASTLIELFREERLPVPLPKRRVSGAQGPGIVRFDVPVFPSS